MTRTRDPLYPAQEVRLRRVVVAAMFLAELLDPLPVGGTEVFPDDLLRDIPTDVFAVVAWLFGLGFLLLRLEDLGTDGLVLRGVVGEDERALAIGGGPYEISEDGVIGLLAGQPVDSLKDVFF